MQNKVYTNDEGILVIETVGPQTEESVNAMGDQARELIASLQAEHKAVLVLDDITQLGAVPPAARKVVISLGKTLLYDRLAMLGKKGSIIRIGANLLLGAMGKGDKAHYFDDRDVALSWLRQYK
jgi:hypothetical protein